MSVSQGVNKITGPKPSHMGDHDGEQSVAGDVEGHPQPHVCRSLVQLAGKLSVGAIELDLELQKLNQRQLFEVATRQWQGGKAILFKSAGFQAQSRIRRSSGLVLISIFPNV